MMTEQQMRMMMEMFANPAFKQGAGEYFRIAQQQGLEAARQFWQGTPFAAAFPDAGQMQQRIEEFYAAFGYVPATKVDELQQQNDSLRAENQLLRDTIRELQQSFIAENGAKAQQAWQEIVDKQLEMSREATKSFFDVLKQSKPPQ